jgi:hypothetical protein
MGATQSHQDCSEEEDCPMKDDSTIVSGNCFDSTRSYTNYPSKRRNKASVSKDYDHLSLNEVDVEALAFDDDSIPALVNEHPIEVRPVPVPVVPTRTTVTTQPSRAATPMPGATATLSEVRLRQKSQFNPHKVLAGQRPNFSKERYRAGTPLLTAIAGQQTPLPIPGQRPNFSKERHVGSLAGSRPTSAGPRLPPRLLPPRPTSAISRPTSAISVKSAMSASSTHSGMSTRSRSSRQLQPGSLITIGTDKRTVEEVKEAIDIIRAEQKDDESLPAPWHETQMKVAQYFKKNDIKTRALECPIRPQFKDALDPISYSQDAVYLEKLYNLRTWNMYKLISEAREDGTYEPSPSSLDTSSHHGINDDVDASTDDMMFDME